ncbi:hypothetical protein EBU99_00440 [bacterium]|nr:hypothetical protein [bacterium]
MLNQSAKVQTWQEFGRRLLARYALQSVFLLLLWIVLLFVHELRTQLYQIPALSAHPVASWTRFSLHWKNFLQDLGPAAVPALLTLQCVAAAWTLLGIALRIELAIVISLICAGVAGAFSRFPIPERASVWLIWGGVNTPRLFQFSLIMLTAAVSLAALARQLTAQYERLNLDRLALAPEEEDLANRSLVQSMLLVLCVLLGGSLLWSVANVRPVPAIAAADRRELRPSVILFAVDHPIQSEELQKRLGEPIFHSSVVFGSPDTSAKFDEILQCRYPIRLIGQTANSGRNLARGINEFFVPAALDSAGYSVSLLHTASAGETSEALKILSRSYAHIKLFRRFGLLLPSRVFYTPGVQMAQVREALSLAVSKGEPAFVTASLLSRDGRKQTSDDFNEFATFLDSLAQQGWLKNMLFVLVELPFGVLDRTSNLELSLRSTSASVSVWMPGSLAETSLSQPPPSLVRGIDLGASLAARLRLSSLVSQCDGAALFDLSERPSLFPRDLVYQEIDIPQLGAVFRKRGWLSADGYRLELQETHEGAVSRVFKVFDKNRLAQNGRQMLVPEEVAVSDPAIALELNRQMDEFLRGTGVEILSLGNGRQAYSEPFRRVRLLER